MCDQEVCDHDLLDRDPDVLDQNVCKHPRTFVTTVEMTTIFLCTLN